ncbi:MAG: DUF721 domain-containing protein [Candidatus Cloacimonetes bacterium]|nr:DUF721 domain-containing protein [Candidatus Cloacimonadota bacterium]HPM00853.1 DUF721 domain-containing protein [Candidatus Cloacimonadota bacterium]
MKNLRDSIYQFVYEIARKNNCYEFAHIALSWSSIVGKIMAERSSLVKFERSVLFVKTINHAWMQEFLLKKKDILQALYDKDIKYVKDIIFFI